MDTEHDAWRKITSLLEIQTTTCSLFILICYLCIINCRGFLTNKLHPPYTILWQHAMDKAKGIETMTTHASTEKLPLRREDKPQNQPHYTKIQTNKHTLIKKTHHTETMTTNLHHNLWKSNVF